MAMIDSVRVRVGKERGDEDDRADVSRALSPVEPRADQSSQSRSCVDRGLVYSTETVRLRWCVVDDSRLKEGRLATTRLAGTGKNAR